MENNSLGCGLKCETYKRRGRRKKDHAAYIILFAALCVGFLLGLSAGLFINGPLVRTYSVEPTPVEVVKTMAEIVPVAEEVAPPPVIYDFTESEVYLLAQLLCGQTGTDGDGEYDFETQIAKNTINWIEVDKVLKVVMNRVLSGSYANNVQDVVMQPGAFSVMPQNSFKTPAPEVVATVQYWCDSFNSSDYEQKVPDDHYWFSGSRGSNITRDHF